MCGSRPATPADRWRTRAGTVIGINTAIVNGLGVAAPVSSAVDFLRRGGRPSLGVTLRPAAARACSFSKWIRAAPQRLSALRAGDFCCARSTS